MKVAAMKSSAVRQLVRCAVETVEARTLFAAPALDNVANYSVPVGKTIQIPLTSTSGSAVTYSFRSGSTSVKGGARTGNTYIQMKVAGYSEPMVFQLFNDTAPETVRRITGLINAKYYDGLTFHRIINDFVIQGGDPSGDGTGGPAFSFDDEFDVNTTFTGTGQLAMANSGKDTNGSQFFITEGPQRLLDNNHTIFGQLVRGEATRAAISDVSTDSNGTPSSDVVITSVRVLSDVQDGVLVVKPSAAGTYNVKVTATNADGSTSKTFTITATADTINDPPILNTSTLQKVYYATAGVPISINLSSIDPEGDAGYFAAQFLTQNGASGTYGGTNNNIVTITPAAGSSGVITLAVGVADSASPSSRGSTSYSSSAVLGGVYDTQTITIAVGDLPISATAASFDALSGVSTGSTLVGSFRDTDTTSSAGQFTAKIDWGDGTVTDGTVVRSRAGRFNVYGTKTYGSKVSGTEPITITVTGNLGATATATAYATVRAAATVTDGILTINGTANGDKIAVSRKSTNYLVTVNGVTSSFATSTVTSMQIYGLAGSDLITLADTVYATTYIEGGDGNDNITGGSGDDVINAGAGDDTVYTGSGSNRVAGADGNDTLVGGIGRDRIFGGAGNDSINGGAGRDILSGDEGNDIIVGGAAPTPSTASPATTP
ncbi:MAG: peptidylprolyl isomerase [Tepidisphaeraceae bacterium]